MPENMLSPQEVKMSTYMDSVRAQSETQISNKLATREASNQKSEAEWTERLTPLEDRLAKLLATIPAEIKSQGLSLPALRTMLAGKWRGKCHPGELGIALRRLGYERRRNWNDGSQSFCALWYQSDVEK
ncbi:hypothetical protein B9Z49_16225 [Limnohabitans sp. 2KL-51]|nr:hypothetical protein B9Z49_16225 [Limnohabitans sp. 2KL-51]